MKYWLFVTDEDNWKIIRDKEIYGFNDKTKKLLEKLNENDLVIVYIKGKLIGGCFEIKSLKEESKIKFNGGGYPYKIKLKKIIVPESPMDFTKNMIDSISIFKDKKKWGTILMGRATKEITKKDYYFLEERLRC
ncbi:MAG: EVE domain-containing protein [archaeon]